MTQKHQRSRKQRRIFKKVAKGIKVVYEKRKPSKPKCGNCGKPLFGMLRERPNKMKNISKSKKRPSRKFAGNLCSKCTREILKNKVRK